jgi:hypothetical protein
LILMAAAPSPMTRAKIGSPILEMMYVGGAIVACAYRDELRSQRLLTGAYLLSSQARSVMELQPPSWRCLLRLAFELGPRAR